MSTGITAVVSLLGRNIEVPVSITHHVMCTLDDAVDADIIGAFNTALPFIDAAVSRGLKVNKHLE